MCHYLYLSIFACICICSFPFSFPLNYLLMHECKCLHILCIAIALKIECLSIKQIFTKKSLFKQKYIS